MWWIWPLTMNLSPNRSMSKREAEDEASMPICGEELNSNAIETVSNEEPKTNYIYRKR